MRSAWIAVPAGMLALAPVAAFADILIVCPAADNVIIPDPAINCTSMVDLDNGGQVGLADFVLFAASFNLSAGKPGIDIRADLDGDGEVDMTDFALFAMHWQHQ